VFQFEWDEQYRLDYFESGDSCYLVREVVGADDEQAARLAAREWVGDSGAR
jgi:hypothetical protein